MKAVLLILLIISYNTLAGQSLKNTGAVKFYFTDSLNIQLSIKSYCVIYNEKVVFVSPTDTCDFKSSLIYAKPGVYTFCIQTKEFKEAMICDVEIKEEKTTFATVKLYPMASVKDMIKLQKN